MSDLKTIAEVQNEKRQHEATMKVITLDEHERVIAKMLRDQRSRYPAEVLEALAKAQEEIFNPCKNRTVSVLGKEGRGGFAYEYAELNVVTEIIRLPLSKNGLSVLQTVSYGDRGAYVMTILGHSSGEVIEFRYPLFIEDSQRMKADQSFAAGFTYAKRQALKGIFAIADDTEDRDSQDGNSNATIVNKEKKQVTQSQSKPGPIKKPEPAKAAPGPAKDRVSATELTELGKLIKNSNSKWTAVEVREFSKKAFGLADSRNLNHTQLAQLKQALEMTQEAAHAVFASEPPPQGEKAQASTVSQLTTDKNQTKI